MYKVTKRDCPMFGIGPYVCEFICDTASDITTLPTSISEGTGGKSAYDNQKCASGSIANVAENGAESKQYMLNNQDIWCPYSVAAGSSESVLEEAKAYTDSEITDLINGAPTTLDTLKEIADAMAEVPNIKVNSAVNADTVNGHTVNADVPADAKFTDTVPDLTPYALKSKYGDTTINVGRKANTNVGVCSNAEGYNSTASGGSSHAEGNNTTATGSCSHAEGYYTTASGYASHAEGNQTIASGAYSHSGGTNTKALHDNEIAYGYYNKSNDNTLFSIGDGTADDARHNAFEITKTGGKLHDKDIATLSDIPPEINITTYTVTFSEITWAESYGGKGKYYYYLSPLNVNKILSVNIKEWENYMPNELITPCIKNDTQITLTSDTAKSTGKMIFHIVYI